jgi:uncharacterized repeat protein (TIGR01451 family)
MMHRKLTFTTLALVMIAALLLSPALPTVQAAPRSAPDAPDAAYPFTVTPAGDITDTGTIPDNACSDLGWPNTRYFLVNDHFNVTDLNVRFNASHGSRGQIRVILTSPADAAGATVQQTIVATSSDTDNNYDILLDADSGGSLDAGSGDNTADPVDRTVLQTLLNSFENRDARGAWRMDICDNSAGTTGTLNLATLYFTGDPIAASTPVFSQGPAVLETYYIPYPESELWTAMGTLYYPSRSAANGDSTSATSCADYSQVNANPRQPIIGYTGITVAEADTIIYYDQWEDGYEPAISYPSQSTTGVWGDGVLTNGRAPGDADDILAAGQIVILNDVKDSTAAEVVDFDARDKIAATKSVAVSRSAWANGSTTLFAAADEVYPTSMWGTDYRVPVGETAADLTHDSFQYTGVSVIAAEDGTVVHINRDNTGPDEMTCNLNQGESCQWDDKSNAGGIMGVNNVIGNGLIVGSHIYSNKKIQVGLLTGDVCAGYETRSYTMLPTDRWSNQYYAPVSSSTSSRTIGSTSNTMPTVVTLYNPGTSALTVNWTFGTGATGSQSIAANSTYDVTIPNGTAARFYATGNFYAIGTVDGVTGTDYDGAATDWGYTLVPVSSMSQYLIVGWAPGADPNIPNSDEDSAPIWLTGGHTTNPASTTAFTVCIDEGGNGGANTDPITGRTYDRTITVTPFQQQIVYDTRVGVYGETGMQLWACDATNGTDAVITAAWGEDPDTINSFGKPTMDMGCTVRNLAAWNMTKGVSLLNDLNGNGLYDEGDTVRFTVTVNNAGAGIPAGTLKVTDQLPTGVTYVANSTWVDYHDATANLNLTDGVATPFPLDDEGGGVGGYTYSLILPPAQSFKVYFDATIDAGAGGASGNTVCNLATGSDGTLEQGAEACMRVQEPEVGTIGNYVWFDEDGDGDQDAGEAGIPNVTVNLYDGSGALLATTYTDANGGYLFPNLLPGNYRVDVIASTLPDSDGNPATVDLFQTYDEDNGTGPFTTPHSTTVSLGSGEEHLTADFGYNWAPPGDTNNPPVDALGAIGDRVWIDTDGDGVQDMGEAGIGGVPVQLYYDSDGDGDIDAIWTGDTGNGPGVAVTNAAGNYIFDQLPAGIYEVRVNNGAGVAGYTQTGDPDQFGATCTGCDSITTTPIVLGPGDVFLNADFGYQPTTSFSIGNLVFLDANADGNFDPDGNDGNPLTTADNETGIPGVTVALLRDDGDGVYEPGIDPIVATTITDASGGYQFSGLPGGTQYWVWVNDTENVLGEVTQSAEPGGSDGGAPCSTCNDVSPTVVVVGPDNIFQDFGYTPTGQTSVLGAIGDTVFLDANNDNNFDQGEGIEGVVVALYNTIGDKIAQTATDENGHYYFGGLDPNNVTYVVQVQTSTLPNGGAGLTNHVDPDDASPGGDSFSTWTLTPAAPINLDQDFGYIPANPGSIGNLVWQDTNADGFNDGPNGPDGVLGTDDDEPGIGGVTVDLYEDRNNNGSIDSGDRLVGQTTTAPDGSYLFPNLPAGNYLVDVTDDAQVLNGYWHSLGAAGTDNNSQTDPYPVTLAAGQDYVAADFGYYVDPGAVGNRVWLDADGNGIQDAGESGIDNVVVKLTITYPNGQTTVLTTLTDATGYYSFGNLLLDEDYNGAGTYGTEPTYSISVDATQPALAGSPYVTLIKAAGSTVYDDSDDPAGTPALPVQGQTNTSFANDAADIASYDFGFSATPTSVTLRTLQAAPQTSWQTVLELLRLLVQPAAR